MIVGFSTKFPKGSGSLSGKPTLFVEKIWESILKSGVEIKVSDFLEYGRRFLPVNYKVGTNKPKPHTIRIDKHNRWKVGMKIHFNIGVRTKNMFRFAPILTVKSIQKIEIKYHYNLGDGIQSGISVKIDGKVMGGKKITALAINDGFDSVREFFEWFKEDFEGKIIHWTDLKY